MRSRSRAVLNWFADPLHVLAAVFSVIPIFFVALYMASYGRNVPFSDQWHFSSEIAVAVKNGTLTLDDLVKPYNDHRVLFTNIGTALNAYFLDWNLKAEMWVNLALALAYFGLLLSIFRQREKDAFVYALVPLSAIVFSLNHQYNWLLGHHTGWHYAIFFLIAGFWTLQTYRPGWKPFLGAAFLSLCATFSFGSGSIVWALLLGGMWMLGYRDWRYYAVWIAAAAVSVILYNAGSPESGQSFGAETLRFHDPYGLALYILALLGNAVTWFSVAAARTLAVMGLIMYAANLFFLWHPERNWKRVAPWLVIGGYGIGSSIGIALARFDSAQPSGALINRLVGASLPFWFALVAVMVIVIARLWNTQQPRLRILLFCNIIFAAVLGVSYLRASAFTLQIAQESFRYNHRLDFTPEVKFEESCMLAYPLTRDFDCFEQITGWIDGGNIDEHTYRLAAYKLTIFATQEPAPILADSQNPIIIDSPSIWLNVYIRDWMLPGDIDEARLFHIAPPENALSTDDLPRPLGDNRAVDLSESTRDALRDFAGESETVWYIFTPETADHEAVITDTLRELDLYATVVPITGERYRDAKFTLFRFQRKPDDTQARFRFGEGITLQAWTLRPETVRPCEILTVESWWLAEAPPDFNYSATVVLADENGDGVARMDGELAGIPMQLWGPDQFFFDSRALQIPCDLPLGTYQLRVGLYNYETLADLPVTDAEGSDSGTRAILEILSIE